MNAEIRRRLAIILLPSALRIQAHRDKPLIGWLARWLYDDFLMTALIERVIELQRMGNLDARMDAIGMTRERMPGGSVYRSNKSPVVITVTERKRNDTDQR